MVVEWLVAGLQLVTGGIDRLIKLWAVGMDAEAVLLRTIQVRSHTYQPANDPSLQGHTGTVSQLSYTQYGVGVAQPCVPTEDSSECRFSPVRMTAPCWRGLLMGCLDCRDVQLCQWVTQMVNQLRYAAAH